MLMSIRTIVADDDEQSLRQLLRLLSAFSEVEIVGLATEGQEALALIERLRPDLAFLEIGLPLLDSFEVYEQLVHRPQIVFITALTIHRRRASRLALAGFLGKPVGGDDLERLFARLKAADSLSPELKD
jgi:two-component system, LytTR family, response regulator